VATLTVLRLARTTSRAANLDPIALLDGGAAVAGGPPSSDLGGAHGFPVGDLVTFLCEVRLEVVRSGLLLGFRGVDAPVGLVVTRRDDVPFQLAQLSPIVSMRLATVTGE
jgi:hypothetical protein